MNQGLLVALSIVFSPPAKTQARGAPILGEYLGGALTCDAHHMTDPRADGLGVSTCIELALKDARVERDAVRCPGRDTFPGTQCCKAAVCCGLPASS